MPLERVFLDANVLISAIVFPGNERKLLDLALDGEIKVVLSEFVLREVRRVIPDKFPESASRLEAVLSSIDYELVTGTEPLLVERAGRLLRDPDDAPILASILASKPDVALTGDKDLLTDEVRAVAPMCRCAEYLQRRGG